MNAPAMVAPIAPGKLGRRGGDAAVRRAVRDLLGAMVLDRAGGALSRLAVRVLDPAEQVWRLDLTGRHDPERFWRDKTELAGQIVALAHDARERLG